MKSGNGGSHFELQDDHQAKWYDDHLLCSAHLARPFLGALQLHQLNINQNKCDGKCDFHWFNGSHFDFWVKQQSQSFSSGTIGFLVLKNMGVDTNIVSLSILEAEL